MSDGNDLDFQQAIERGTKKMALSDLQQKGLKSVKVLDERVLEEIVRKAVDRVVSSQTAEEKARIYEESRKELERLIQEHRAAKSRAQLLEEDKNDLVGQIEALQRELELRSQLEEERLHKKFVEGTASMQKQVEEVRSRAEATGQDLERLRVENARLEATLKGEREKLTRSRELEPRFETALKNAQDLNRQNARYQTELEAAGTRLSELEGELENKQSLIREGERARTEMVEQVLKLQARAAETAKGLQELESARAQLVRAEELVRDGAKENSGLKARGADLEERLRRVQADLASRTADAARLEGENGPLRKDVEHLRSVAAGLEESLAQERSKSQSVIGDSAGLRERLEAVDLRLREKQADLDRARTQVEELEKALAEEQFRSQGQGVEAASLRERMEATEIRLREKESAAQQAQHLASKLEGAIAEERSKAENIAESSNEERKRADQAEHRARETGRELERAQAQIQALEQEVERERTKARESAAKLEEAVAQERSKAQDFTQSSNRERERADRAESRARETGQELERAQAQLQALAQEIDGERLKAKKATEEARTRESEIQLRLSDADRVEVERVGLQQELARLRADLAGLETLRIERDQAFAALQDSKEDARALRLEIARAEQEKEAQREKIVVVASDLEEIEAKHHSEQQELEGLRQKSQALEDQLAKTRDDHAQAHAEMQSLQEILQREQEVSRTAHVESSAAQERLQELTSAAARLEEQSRRLSEENAGLKERLQSAELGAAAASALDHRLASVERLMDAARAQSGIARASAADSKAAAETLRKTVLGGNPAKKKKPGAAVPSGVALDGDALLQEYFRRIHLKERLQKHVPVREKEGQRHPSDLLVDVVSALIAGDGRGENGKKSGNVEILGPSRGPEVADLRQFLGRVSPRAGHAVSQVHSALRHSLFSMPEKPKRLVLDVGSVDLPRSYRPLVAYEPDQKEFWHGELRTKSDPDSRGVVPFLKECLSKVPGTFPRSRVRLRLDARYFSEDVVRYLNSRGCSYVMEAPDRAPLRDAARKSKFRELSGGWEAGEFRQRIHPIRKTLGRFVVLRHRLSRKGRPERPMFRDKTWEYCVFVVDPRISPWRAYQAYEHRGKSQADSAEVLKDFTGSRLLGRRRRAHGALFPLYLMASDLLQWFRRKALPVEERGRTLESLRTELLKLPSTGERSGKMRLPVLRKNDKARKSFERVLRKIRRLRPVRSFKLNH